MKIDRKQWEELSGLLDDALDIEPAQREAFLVGLPDHLAPLRGLLSTLLAQQDHIETDDFLKAPNFSAALLREATQQQEPEADLQSGMQVGAYHLLRQLGQGGMGYVWLAERTDGRFQRQVALKFPYAGAHRRQLAERLGRERDILARLEHPNIARLYDADVTAFDQPFLVLEYVDGIPFNDYCDRERLSVRERLVLFLQVLAATQYAHSHLVIHRDLKPSNILITNDRVVRLLDFGIAKLVSDDEGRETPLTRFEGRVLTPDYASPEQIAGQPITTASDVYSLGVVLYEVLTGTRPYRLKRDSRASLEEAIAEADVIAPSRATFSASVAEQRATSSRRLVRILRGDLDAILHKTLQKRPVERYASVDTLTRDIKHWLDGEGVEARSPSIWYGLRKLIRRNRLPFFAAAAVLLSLLVGAAIAIGQARIAIAQAERLQATKTFLVGLFNANSMDQQDPLKAQQTTARELLDRAAARLATDKQPAVEETEEMLAILGNLYQDLGLSDKSAALRLQRMTLLRQLDGPDSVKLAAAEVEYAKSLYDTNDWKKARAPLEDAERILDRRHDDASFTRALQLGATAEYLRGVDRKRSRDYAARAIALERLKFPKSEQLIEDLHSASLIDSETGHRDRALPLLREALALQEGAGIAEIHLIRPLIELAELQSLALDNAAAESNFRRGLEISQRLNGEASVDTIQCRLRFGKFLRGTGRLRESEAVMQVAEQNGVVLLGNEETFHLPSLRDQLAQTEYALGNYATAAALYRRAIAARETARAGNRQHAHMLTDYAQLLNDMGHADESERLLTRATAYYLSSDVDVAATDVPVVLSATYSALGRHADALQVLERYTEGRELLTPVMQIEWAMRRAAVYAEMSDTVQAESILRRQLQTLADLHQADNLRLLEAKLQLQLGRLLLERHVPDEARERLEASYQVLAAELSPHSPLLADTAVALAQCLLMQGDRVRSAALFDTAQTIQVFNVELGAQYRQPLQQLKAQLSQLTNSRRHR